MCYGAHWPHGRRVAQPKVSPYYIQFIMTQTELQPFYKTTILTCALNIGNYYLWSANQQLGQYMCSRPAEFNSALPAASDNEAFHARRVTQAS